MKNLANEGSEGIPFTEEAVNEVVNGETGANAQGLDFEFSSDAAEADAAEADVADVENEGTEEGVVEGEGTDDSEAETKNSAEEKKPMASKMPEFIGSAAERAIQKIDWEVKNTNPFHDDKDKEEKTPYAPMLQMLLPKISNALVDEFKKLVENDEALAERVNLPHKSLKACWKQTFTALVDAQMKSGTAKLTLGNGLSGYAGVGDSDDFCRLMKAYYEIDDKAYLDEQERKAREKKKKEAEQKAKAEANKKKAESKKTGAGKSEEKKQDDKKAAPLSLFDGFGM